MARGADMQGLVRHLRATGQLTAGLILRALLSSNLDLFDAALAELADLPLARVSALLHDPEVFVIDEPMVGLDPQHARVVKDVLKERSLAGMTVLVSTHYMDEAERCHEIAYIAYGELMHEIAAVTPPVPVRGARQSPASRRRR